jgi:SagB-type dehydrogenase family enzyme
MKLLLLLCGILGAAVLLSGCASPAGDAQGMANDLQQEAIKLPPPALKSDFPLERAINERMSHRSYGKRPLTLEEVGQLLWAAQGAGMDGVTEASRTAPSAGATHPLEIYLVAGEVDGLDPGVYRYQYCGHSLVKTAGEDRRERLAAAALRQNFVAGAPVSIVLAADYARTTSRYGERGLRYVHMEVGHVTQNIYLQCIPLELGAVAVGAFDDEKVKVLLEIEEEPLMLIPVGDIS